MSWCSSLIYVYFFFIQAHNHKTCRLSTQSAMLLDFYLFIFLLGMVEYTHTGSMSVCAQVNWLIWQDVIRFGKQTNHMRNVAQVGSFAAI